MTNMKNRSPHTIGQIKSLEDLKLEKARLEMDILKKENQIQSDYRKILDRLTFRNVIQNIKEDIALTTNVTSKVISVGKKLFGKKKKKKKSLEEKTGPSLPQESPAQPEVISGE
jgi:hypothetical protein